MKEIFYYSSIYTIGSIVTKVISFLIILWLGSHFSSNEYAQFALLYSLHQGITTFSIAGINESVAGFLKKATSTQDKEYLFSNVLASIIPSSFFALISSIFFYVFYLQYKNPELVFIYTASAILSSLFLGFSLFKSQMNRLKENHFASILYLFLPQIVMFLGGVICVSIFENSQAFFIGSALSLLITLLISALLYRNGNLPMYNGKLTKKIVVNSSPYYLIAVIGWFGGYGNNFIINIYFDSFAIAAFTFIYTISGIMLMISNALNQVWAPRFYNTFGKVPFSDLEHKNNYFYGILAIVMGVAVSAIIVIYPLLLKMIGGNLLSYVDMKLELYLILLSYIIYTPIWHYRIHFYANSMGNSLMKVTIISSILGLISMILFINFFDNIGIYYGFLSMTLINLLLTSIVALKKWRLNINWIGIIIGTTISLITFYLSYYDYSIFYSIIFVVSSIILSGIYVYKNNLKIV